MKLPHLQANTTKSLDLKPEITCTTRKGLDELDR
jgi:hypothetical protein